MRQEFVEVTGHMSDIMKRQGQKNEAAAYKKVQDALLKLDAKTNISNTNIKNHATVPTYVQKHLDKYVASNFKSGRVGMTNREQSALKETIEREHR
jgi:hypothetical protein